MTKPGKEKSAPAEPFHVGIVFTPGFSLMAYSSTVEPLRMANHIGAASLYRWSHFSPAGGSVVSGGGLEVMTEPLPKLDRHRLDMVVVCGGMTSHLYRNPVLDRFLRDALHRRVLIGSASTATFILAAAGILRGRRCTIHWDYLDAFREAYPEIETSGELFTIDHGVFTCAGGISAMDVMLRFIGERYGREFAAKVAEQFIYGGGRDPSDRQRIGVRTRLGVAQPVLIRALEMMENAVETPLRTAEVAGRVGVSMRHLERLFSEYVGCTPSQQYLRIRLDRARKLLRSTSLSVMEVALACGFASASHFARAYKAHHGLSPRDDRASDYEPAQIQD
ncbi:MAG: GlxA family transcriptional regulator [Hyphomicrobiales bacterium]